MKKLLVRMLLLGLLSGVFLTQAWTTPTVKADSVGNCGMPYRQQVTMCYMMFICWDMGEEACADCDGGTYCYPIY